MLCASGGTRMLHFPLASFFQLRFGALRGFRVQAEAFFGVRGGQGCQCLPDVPGPSSSGLLRALGVPVHWHATRSAWISKVALVTSTVAVAQPQEPLRIRLADCCSASDLEAVTQAGCGRLPRAIVLRKPGQYRGSGRRPSKSGRPCRRLCECASGRTKSCW